MTTIAYSERIATTPSQRHNGAPAPLRAAELHEIDARDGSVAWLFAIYLSGFAAIALTTLVGLLQH